MNVGASSTSQHQNSLHYPRAFLLITFGLAWGIWGLFILLPKPMIAMLGELTGQHPLFFLAVYALAIAAFIIITYRAGAGGLRRLSRLYSKRFQLELIERLC